MRESDIQAVFEAYTLALRRMDEPAAMEFAVEVLRGRRKAFDKNTAWNKVASAIANGDRLH